jgi:hypothetical protein
MEQPEQTEGVVINDPENLSVLVIPPIYQNQRP